MLVFRDLIQSGLIMLKESRNKHYFSILPLKRKKLRYMLLTRDVMDLADTRRKSSSEDFMSILNTLQQEIHSQYDVEILVKPHPKQNIINLKRFLGNVGFENPLVVADALYVVLPSVDFAITMQSSGAYYPLTYGLPCIHLAKGEYGQRSYLFNEMEYNLKRVVTNLDDFPNACRALMQELHTSQPIANDVEHMRKFYPDGATNLIIDQIKGYLE